MAQLNPNQYIKIGGGGPTYGSSDGLYYDKTNSKLVLAVAGSVVASWASTGLDDLVTGETRGDILRRGASSWERHVAKASGQILVGDGTDIVSVAVSGDVALSSAGAATVTDLTIASEARGDILRRGASAWERVSAKDSGKVLLGDGTDITSAALSGDVTVNGTGVTAIGASKVLSAMVSPLLVRYATGTLTAAQAAALNSAPQTIIAAPTAGYINVVHRCVLVLNYATAAITDNGIVGLYETDSTGALLTGTLTLASFLGAGADTIKELHPLAHSATTGLTRLDNKAIVLSQATGDSTVGTATSTVSYHVWYSIIPHGL